MIRFTILATLLVTVSFSAPTSLASPYTASEPRTWTPGSSPCNGACPLDWSVTQLVTAGLIPDYVADRVLSGVVEPEEVTIRDGEVVRGMTWARNGTQAVFGGDDYRTQTDPSGSQLVADSYAVRYKGRLWEVLNVRLCDNWTSRSKPIEDPWRTHDDDDDRKRSLYAAPQRGVAHGSTGSSFLGTPTVPQVGESYRVWREDKPREDKEVSPIPVPASILALITGLVGLLVVGRGK